MTFLPDQVSPLAAALVVTASFFTSALTGAFGLGGGLALLAVMSTVFPSAAVIPVHGLAQLGSNASRFVLQRANVVWPIVLWFSAGSLIGTIAGGRVYFALPEAILKAGVGLFVLYTVWGPRPKGAPPGARAFFLTGAGAGFLSMFFGATGPITAAMLSQARLGKLETVATHAGSMVTQHLMKSLAFGALGFAFAAWAPLVAAIIAAGFGGTWFGVSMLKRMPEESFKSGFRLVLTFFGFYLVVDALLDTFRKD